MPARFVRPLLMAAGAALALTLSIPGGSVLADDKPAVVVVDFDNHTKKKKQEPIGAQAADLVASELSKTQHVRVVSRAELLAALRAKGALDDDDRPTLGPREMGELAGADYVVMGTITEWGRSKGKTSIGGFEQKRNTYHATIETQVIETATGSVVLAETGTGEVDTSKVKVMGIGGGEDDKKALLMDAFRAALVDVASTIDLRFATGRVAGGDTEPPAVSAQD